MSLSPLLAQIEDVNQAAQEGIDWLTQDPTGRIVGVAAGVVVVGVALFVFFKMFKWAAARWKMLTAVAIAIAAAVYGVTFLLDMGLTGFLILGGLGFGAFFGFALFATQGGSRR